jgi:hypothetical protein
MRRDETKNCAGNWESGECQENCRGHDRGARGVEALPLRSRVEGIADTTLFFFVTVPLLAVLITVPFCSGWNESTMAGTCTPPMWEGIYNNIMGLFLIIALAGPIFVVGPVVFVAGVVSVVAKISRFADGYRPRTVSAIALEIVLIIPLAVVVYFCLSFLIR